MSARETDKDPNLVVHRDRTVSYRGKRIGVVYPDPGDSTNNHDWAYQHDSGITWRHLRLHTRSRQVSFTTRGAASSLLQLHNAITASTSTSTTDSTTDANSRKGR